MNKKSTTIIIIILGIVIFVLPIIPITYQILYKEEVPILKLTSHTNVVLNSTTLTLEGGTYQFWQKEIEDYKTARFSLRTNETINAAIMSLEEFETFQKTMLMNQTMQSMQDTTSINIEYQIPITETYFFVIHNAHDGLKGAEKKEATINLATITETWESETLEYQIKQGIRTEKTTVTIWQVITGTTPVF